MDAIRTNEIEKQHQDIERKNGIIGQKLTKPMEALKSGYHENAVSLCGSILQSILKDMWQRENIPGDPEIHNTENLLEGVKDRIQDQLIKKYLDEVMATSLKADAGEHLKMEDAFEMFRKLCSVVMWYLEKYPSHDHLVQSSSKRLSVKVFLSSIGLLLIAFICYVIIDKINEDTILKEAKRIVNAQVISDSKNNLIRGATSEEFELPGSLPTHTSQLRNSGLENLDEQNIVLDIKLSDFLDIRYNPNGKYNDKSEIKYIADASVVIDHKYELMWARNNSQDRMTYVKAQMYVNGLNSREYLGYSDWRLPTIIELYSIVSPCESTDKKYLISYFDEVYSSVWSCDSKNDKSAYYMSFEDGTFEDTLKTYSSRVMPVRTTNPEKYSYSSHEDRIEAWKSTTEVIPLRAKSISSLDRMNVELIIKFYNFFDAKINQTGSFPNQFKLIHDGLDEYVVDMKTSLMWYKSKSDVPLNWFKTKTYISELNKNNKKKYTWRLPTIEELCSLTQKKPGKNTGHIHKKFGDKIRHCWTADRMNFKYCYYQHFENGYSDKTINTYKLSSVLPVRTLTPDERTRYLQHEK